MKLSEAIKILSDAGVDDPVYDAKEIFHRIGGIQKSALVLRETESSSKAVQAAIEQRKNRMPLQYIIGEVGFFKEIYKVNPSCLIPRQDTEILVEYAVKNLPDGAHFLDLCTGSGCVAISTLKNTVGTTALALDISRDALSIAKENAKLNGVFERIELAVADVLREPVEGKPFAILSNPPYVAEDAYKKLSDEIYYEPKIAFVGGADGLDFYRRILELYVERLDSRGFFAFEIGYDQGAAITKLAECYSLSAQIIRDLSGLDRVAVLRR